MVMSRRERLFVTRGSITPSEGKKVTTIGGICGTGHVTVRCPTEEGVVAIAPGLC